MAGASWKNYSGSADIFEKTSILKIFFITEQHPPMAYNYLLDLYRVLAERQAEILQNGGAPVQASSTGEPEPYQQGRLDANSDFLRYLKTNYHAKLPRRLQ